MYSEGLTEDSHMNQRDNVQKGEKYGVQILLYAFQQMWSELNALKQVNNQTQSRGGNTKHTGSRA